MQPSIQRILLTTDLSEASWHALGPAVRWAQQFGATLRVLQVNEIPVPTVPVTLLGSIPPPMPDLLEQAREAARESIDRTLATAEVPYEVVQVDGVSPAHVILEEAARPGVDLLVLCTHGRTGLQRFWLGSVAERVIQRAACPVLTVHPETTQVDLPSVLLCTDLSPSSWAALPWAARVASRFDVPLRILSVVEDSLYLTQIGAGERIVPMLQEVEPVVRQRIEDQLRVARSNGELPAEPEVPIVLRRSGTPWECILDEAASPDVGLVVVGTRGLTGLPHVFLGSTAQKLVRLSPTPVLTIHASTSSH